MPWIPTWWRCHLAFVGFQGLAHQFLIDERTVDFGGVEEGNSPLHRLVDEFNYFFFVPRQAVGLAHPHTAEADGRDFQTAFTQFALLHDFLSFVEPLVCLTGGMIRKGSAKHLPNPTNV